MKHLYKLMDMYRSCARRHPIRFAFASALLIMLWSFVIMSFSGEDADISGERSSKILLGIVNAVAPDSGVTYDNYKTVRALFFAEKVIRKSAHMLEYALLSFLIWSFFFAFRDVPRKYAYIIPVAAVFLLGMADENHQKKISGRYGSMFDVCIDTTGAVIAVVIAYHLTKRYRQRKISENNHPSV